MRKPKGGTIGIVIPHLQGGVPAQMVVDRLQEKILEKMIPSQVVEKLRTSPVGGECPTLGRCRCYDSESMHAKERIHVKKEQNVRPHATGLET